MRWTHPFPAIAAALLGVLPFAPVASIAAPTFSTYLGGGQRDFVRDVCFAPDGSIYVVGGAESSSFPSTPGSYDPTWNGVHDAYVVKLSATGTLLWATFLGGPEYDRAYAVEVDPQGLVVVAGRAGIQFPTTPGVLQPAFGGDNNPSSEYGTQDGFLAKLTPDGGTLVWATYFGDAGRAFIRDITVDGAGDVYLVSPEVYGTHPHVTPGAFQTSPGGNQDYVCARISADGTQVRWATYIGGSGDDGSAPSLRIDAEGNAYSIAVTQSPDAPVTAGVVQGSYGGNGDLLLTKFSADGSTLLYGTYFGGSAYEAVETHNLWVQPDGTTLLAATTRSADLPITAGAYQTSFAGGGGNGTGGGTNYVGDGFVARISADGRTLLASTYLGGQFGEGIEGCTMDTDGNVFVSGASFSPDFPTTEDAERRSLSGPADYFVAGLSADLGTLRYSTLFGGSGEDYGRALALGPSGELLVGGQTRSDDWPLAAPVQSVRGGDWDGGVALIRPGGGQDLGCAVIDFRIFPNPFINGTGLSFLVERSGDVQIDIFDTAGRLVRAVCDRDYAVGQQAELWDGRNAAGHRVSPGVYFVRLRSGPDDFFRKTVRIGD